MMAPKIEPKYFLKAKNNKLTKNILFKGFIFDITFQSKFFRFYCLLIICTK